MLNLQSRVAGTVPTASMLWATGCLAMSLTQAAGAQDVPFKGEADGVAQFLSPQEVVIEYTGNATHLGRFTRHEYLFLNDDGFTFQGFMVFTAANGDELWLDFSGMFISPNDAVGTYTFTGGTGRFDGATGTAEFAASTPDFINVSARFSGRIRY